jgi:hypothetical protein
MTKGLQFLAGGNMGIKISELAVLETPEATNVLPVVHAGATYQCTIGAMSALHTHAAYDAHLANVGIHALELRVDSENGVSIIFDKVNNRRLFTFTIFGLYAFDPVNEMDNLIHEWLPPL